MADALDAARVTVGHVDEVTKVTKAAKSLDADHRDELFDRLDRGLPDVAAVAIIAEWRRRLAMEVKHIQRDDGIDRPHMTGSHGDGETAHRTHRVDYRTFSSTEPGNGLDLAASTTRPNRAGIRG